MIMHAIELPSCTVTFIDAEIVHTHFKDDHLVSVDDVQAMFAAIAAERKGRKALRQDQPAPCAHHEHRPRLVDQSPALAWAER